MTLPQTLRLRCLEVDDDGRIVPPVMREGDGAPPPIQPFACDGVTAPLFERPARGLFSAWRRRTVRRV